MSTTLPLFWDLSAGDKKARLGAAAKLVGALERLQVAHEPKPAAAASEEEKEEEAEESGEEVDESEDEGGAEGKGEGVKKEAEMLDRLNAPDVSYSIRRLVRGLASPRESARLGFSVALTELLSRINTVTCAQILAFVIDASQTGGSLSGQEQRDMLFARLFGITALVRSGLLVRTAPLPSSGSAAPHASSARAFGDVRAQLLALGAAKAWLREGAWWALGLAVEQLAGAEVPWRDQALEETVQVVFGDDKVWSPEKVALAVRMRALFPALDWKAILAPAIKHGDVLHSANTAALAKIMKEVDEGDDEEEGKPKGAPRVWRPQVHYAWDVLLDELLPADGAPPRGSFQEFFRVAVDESLFAAAASSARKYWGFSVVARALPRIRGADVPLLFTRNFMRTWMNHLANPDRVLHKFAKTISKSIQEAVARDPQIGFAFVLQLTGVHGDAQFDKLTKTKTVEAILATMDAPGVAGYVKHLLAQVDAVDGEEEQATEARRAWIVEQLAALVRNGAVPKDESWVTPALDFLLVHALFAVKKPSSSGPVALSAPSPPLSDVIRAQVQERLLSALADLTAHTLPAPVPSTTPGGKPGKRAGVAPDGRFWLARAVDSATALAADKKRVKPLVAFDAEDGAALARADAALAELRKGGGDGREEERRGAELLLCAAMLRQRMGAADATSALDECVDGVTRLFAPPKKASKKAKKAATAEGREDGEGAEPAAIDVLVDMIIGFLEQSTAFTRAVGNLSFALLSGAVQASTIDLVLAQLERKDPAELLADSEDEEMDEDGDEEDAEDDAEKSEDDDEEDEDEDEVDLEDDPELRRKLAAALGGAAADGDASDDGSDSDSDVAMDDEQMMALDGQLAAIFKAQAKGKARGENGQREATHFKNRILDLLDAFARTQPAHALGPLLVGPLLELVFGASPDEAQLRDKASGLLRARIAKAKDAPVGADVAAATAALEDVHARARKARGADGAALLAGCGVYLSRALVAAGAEGAVLAAYRASLDDYAQRKACELSAKFFGELQRRLPRTAWGLRAEVLARAGDARNAYRRAQLYGLVQALLNSVAGLDVDKAEVLEFARALHAALSGAALAAADAQGDTLAPAQLKDALKLALSGARLTRRYAPGGDVAGVWAPDVWARVLARLEASERFAGAKGVLDVVRQLLALARGEEGKGKKEKAEKNGKEGKKGKGKPGKAEKVGVDQAGAAPVVEEAAEPEKGAGKKKKRKAEAVAEVEGQAAKKKRTKKSAPA